MPFLITRATDPVGRPIVMQLRALEQEVCLVTCDLCKTSVGREAVQGNVTKEDLPERAFEGAKQGFLFPTQGSVDAFLKQAKIARRNSLLCSPR